MNLDNLSIPDKVKQELWSVMSKFGIRTTERLAHFLGQCHHESGGFTKVRENLNYSEKALLKTFQAFGAEITLKEGSLTPNYEEDDVYADLKAQMKAREELLKIAFRQAGKTAIFDESTGEQVPVCTQAIPCRDNGPSTTSTTDARVAYCDLKCGFFASLTAPVISPCALASAA